MKNCPISIPSCLIQINHAKIKSQKEDIKKITKTKLQTHNCQKLSQHALRIQNHSRVLFLMHLQQFLLKLELVINQAKVYLDLGCLFIFSYFSCFFALVLHFIVYSAIYMKALWLQFNILLAMTQITLQETIENKTKVGF